MEGRSNKIRHSCSASEFPAHSSTACKKRDSSWFRGRVEIGYSFFFLPKNVSHLVPRTAAAVSFRDRVAHLPILRTNSAFSEPLSRFYLAFNSSPSSQHIST